MKHKFTITRLLLLISFILVGCTKQVDITDTSTNVVDISTNITDNIISNTDTLTPGTQIKDEKEIENIIDNVLSDKQDKQDEQSSIDNTIKDNNAPNNEVIINDTIVENDTPSIEVPNQNDIISEPVIPENNINDNIDIDEIEEDPIIENIIPSEDTPKDEPVIDEEPIKDNPVEEDIPIISEPEPIIKAMDLIEYYDYTESTYLDNYDFIKSDLVYPSNKTRIDIVKEYFAKFPLYIQEYIRDNGWTIYVRDSVHYKDKDRSNTLYGLCIYGPKEIYVYAWHPQTIYHEVYHALNFYLYKANNSSIINSIHSAEWENLYNCYYTAKANVQSSGEYFCTAMEVYFYNNELLKENCPRTYNFIRNTMQGVFLVDENTSNKIILQNNKWFDTIIFDEDVTFTKLEKFALPNCPNITRVYYKGKLYMDWDTLVLAMKKDGVDVTKKSFIETGMPK